MRQYPMLPDLALRSVHGPSDMKIDSHWKENLMPNTRSFRFAGSVPMLVAIMLAALSGAPASAVNRSGEEAAAVQPQPGKRIAQIVTIRPKPGMESMLANRILGMAGPTRHEVGNLRYDLFQKEGGIWMIFEYWADDTAVAAHFAAPYSVAFLKDMSQFVEGNPEVTVLQSVDIPR